MYVGGDQNPLRQGLLRLAVMKQRVNTEQLLYFIQDVDTLADGLSTTWQLESARKSYFPFSFDLFNHPEFPNIAIVKNPEMERLRSYWRILFGYPRLVLKGPDLDLILSAVSTDNQEIWPLILKGFQLEINWAIGLVNTNAARQRGQEILELVNGHRHGDLISLIRKIGFFILPALQDIEIGLLTKFYQENLIRVESNECWLVQNNHRQKHEMGEETESRVLVPRGKYLISDMQSRGYQFFATNLSYEDGGYIRIHFSVDLPVNWGALTNNTIGIDWQKWSERPTLISAYIIGGHPLIEQIIATAKVEGL